MWCVKFLVVWVFLSAVAQAEDSVVYRVEPFDSDWHEETIPRNFTVVVDRDAARTFRSVFQRVGVFNSDYVNSKPEKPHVFYTKNSALIVCTDDMPGANPRAHVTLHESDKPDGQVKKYSVGSKSFLKIVLSRDESERLDSVFDIKTVKRATADYAEQIVEKKYLADSAGFVEVECTYEEGTKIPTCSVTVRTDTSRQRASLFPPKIWPGELVKNEDHYSYLDEESRLQWAMPFEDQSGSAVKAVRDIDDAREACGKIGYSLPTGEHFLAGEVTLGQKEYQVKEYWQKLLKTLKPQMSLGRIFTEGHADIRLAGDQILVIDFISKSQLRVQQNADPLLFTEVVCVRTVSRKMRK